MRVSRQLSALDRTYKIGRSWRGQIQLAELGEHVLDNAIFQARGYDADADPAS